MARDERTSFNASLQRTFDSIRPLLVQACGSISQSLHDIEGRHDVIVDAAELELSFNFSASTGIAIAEAKQNSSMTVKLMIRPGKGKLGNVSLSLEDKIDKIKEDLIEAEDSEDSLEF
jgi:Trypsin-co-occurring domain 1